MRLVTIIQLSVSRMRDCGGTVVRVRGWHSLNISDNILYQGGHVAHQPSRDQLGQIITPMNTTRTMHDE